MTLIDDTCDGCGRGFDPMGDPLLTRHPEISPYAVYCAVCQGYEDLKTDPERREREDLRKLSHQRFLKLIKVAAIIDQLDQLVDAEGITVDVAAVDIRRRLKNAISYGDGSL